MISWLAVLFLTPLAVLAARRISSRIAMLALLTICVYPAFVFEAQISFLRAFLLLMFWTLWLSMIVMWLSYKHPESMEQVIWRSAAYTQAMFRWIDTSELPEGSAVDVVLFHFRQTILYCVIAAVSANFLSLLLGAALLNYMNYYVASFARRTATPSLAFVIAWNPWSVIRVVSFLWLGIVFSAPLLRLFSPLTWTLSLKLALPALVGVILDVVLKISLSRPWSVRLRKLTQRPL